MVSNIELNVKVERLKQYFIILLFLYLKLEFFSYRAATGGKKYIHTVHTSPQLHTFSPLYAKQKPTLAAVSDGTSLYIKINSL